MMLQPRLRSSLPAVMLLVLLPVATADSPEIIGTHDLGWNSRGELAFTQLSSEQQLHRAGSASGSTQLFSVVVNFDVEDMDTTHGVTMVFDRKQHKLRLDANVAPIGSIAWGNYVDSMETNGWSQLSISSTSNREVSNDVRVYSAGFIEGILTCVRISQHFSNVFQMIKKADTSSHAVNGIKTLLQNEIAFMRNKANLVPHIMTEEPTDNYWKHSRYMLFQLWGLKDGYDFMANHFHIHDLGMIDFFMLNSVAELPALMKAYSPQALADRAPPAAPLSFLQRGRNISRPNLRSVSSDISLDDAHWKKLLRSEGHCSAFIRTTRGNADLLVGHTTWNDYSTMMRVFKYYNMPLANCGSYSQNMGFSSYPGMLHSPDSYYVLDSSLVVMDTSLEILDLFIWEQVKDFGVLPRVPSFVHIMITNRMARSAVHWAQLYNTINTGTYNSQWMIVDYNQFVPGQQIRDNTLWVIETVPGLTHMADVSHFLRDFGYWPSFNRPYFDVIRDAIGFTAAAQSAGDMYSWGNNPRARIFRSVSEYVNSHFDMRGLMDRNLYPFEGAGEPIDPGHAISARNDLSPQQAFPNGGIDAKLTSRCLIKSLQVQAESGPTHVAQPLFRWKDSNGRELWPGTPHNGLPNIWNFGYVQITPNGIVGIKDELTC